VTRTAASTGSTGTLPTPLPPRQEEEEEEDGCCVNALQLLRCQHLYFCTSIKRRVCGKVFVIRNHKHASHVLRECALQLLRRQHLYFLR
jgi:hypothetical protein